MQKEDYPGDSCAISPMAFLLFNENIISYAFYCKNNYHVNREKLHHLVAS